MPLALRAMPGAGWHSVGLRVGVVLIGRDAPLIEAALASTGVTLVHAASMDEAVQQAARRAHPGDAVLLSPACSSYDMFKNYEERGALFKRLAAAQEDEKS